MGSCWVHRLGVGPWPGLGTSFPTPHPPRHRHQGLCWEKPQNISEASIRRQECKTMGSHLFQKMPKFTLWNSSSCKWVGHLAQSSPFSLSLPRLQDFLGSPSLSFSCLSPLPAVMPPTSWNLSDFFSVCVTSLLWRSLMGFTGGFSW